MCDFGADCSFHRSSRVRKLAESEVGGKEGDISRGSQTGSSTGIDEGGCRVRRLRGR